MIVGTSGQRPLTETITPTARTNGNGNGANGRAHPHGNGHGPGAADPVAAPPAARTATPEALAPAPPPVVPGTQRLAELQALRRRAADGPAGSSERQHARGKLTARERIELLLDPGSFVELDMFAVHRAVGFGLEDDHPLTDGVVTGWGTVDGRTIAVYAHDFRIFGGALGEVHAGKIHKVQDLAASVGCPLVGLNDGVGARIQEGVSALDGYGGIFVRNARASGVVPQVSVMLGPCAGGAVYSPALTDFVFAVRGVANMFITGPDVVRKVTGEVVGKDELGGADVHATRSGVAHVVTDDEESCIEDVRYLLSFLPSNNHELPPAVTPTDDPERRCEGLLALLPDRPTEAYDVRRIIAEVVDDGELFELQEQFARSIVCAFARLDGQVVGIVANQPSVLAGVLDIDSSEKAARFVRTCDAFNVPLVTFVDVPGFLPGTAQEHNGIIRHGAKLLFAYCEATVPRIQLVLRKAYGGAYIVMDSKGIGADLSFAWPTNEVAVMGAEPAADIVFRKEIAAAEDPDATRRRLVADYEGRLAGPFVAAERGMVDDVIDPADTRRIVIRSLRMLRSKHEALPQRKHGNVPL
jgi:acetyl-CoA carboxylase carboxyltransferase component